MDTNTAIEVQGVSKLFHNGDKGNATISNTIKQLFNAPFHHEDQGIPIWALRDITFSVKEGEVLGIIGKNGSGKSTLLKIISKIIRPTAGVVNIRGKISALLEVGTGYHPDLTGRENVFMNGSLLGMSKREVRNKFDEIVAFSGIGEYIDEPVKHYSTGMYMRLGFSAALHLTSDIIIIDEALAVGDAEFQFACLQKIKDLTAQGASAIMVSHGMNNIVNLCDQVLYLKSGKMMEIGSPLGVINNYMTAEQDKIDSILKKSEKTAFSWDKNTDQKNDYIHFNNIKISKDNTAIVDMLTNTDALTITLELTVLKASPDVELMFSFHKTMSSIISVVTTNMLRMNPHVVFNHAGIYEVKCKIPAYFFKKGLFSVNVGVKEGNEITNVWPTVLSFYIHLPEIESKDQWFVEGPFDVGPIFQWEMEKIL